MDVKNINIRNIIDFDGRNIFVYVSVFFCSKDISESSFTYRDEINDTNCFLWPPIDCSTQSLGSCQRIA